MFVNVVLFLLFLSAICKDVLLIYVIVMFIYAYVVSRSNARSLQLRFNECHLIFWVFSRYLSLCASISTEVYVLLSDMQFV